MRTPGSLSHILYPLKKRWYVVLLCIMIASVAATRYLYMATPEYQASATLKVEDAQQGESNSNLYRDFDVFKSNNKVQTEVEVLKSRNFFMKALDRLDFFVEYYHEGEMKTEEIYGTSPILVDYRITDSTFYSQAYEFRYLTGNKFKVSYDFNGTEIEKEGEFGKEICDHGVCVTVHKNDKIIRYKTTQYLEEPWKFIVYSKNALTSKYLTKDYLVKAVDKDVNVIKVYYTHPIAEKAVKLVNAVAQSYIDQSIAEKQEFAGSTVEFINQQLEIVGKELDDARDAIKSYRIRYNIVNIPQATEATYKTIGELDLQRVDLDMQLSVLENMSDYLRHNTEIKFTGPEFNTVVDPLFTESVSHLNTKLRERDEMMKTYTAEDDRIKNINADIQQQKAFLIESVNNTRRKLLTKQDEIYSAIDDEKATFKGVPEKESTLQELTRNYFLFEKIYNFLIEKKTEALITRQVNVSFSRILEMAMLPLAAVSPHADVVWGVALFLGLVIGIAMTYFRHYMKPSINAPEDISPNSSIPVMGHVEKIRCDQPAYKAFTALSTKIMMNMQVNKPIVITVTSTRKGEGKSFIATNLARTLAAMDKKVILLDLNSYKPCLGELFDVRRLEGIKEVYSQHTPVQDVIQLTSIPNLDIITSGVDEAPISHLIATNRTKEILDELCEQYDAVIVDTPEVGEYTDAIPFMKWSDLNLYVLRAESGSNELIANAEMVKEEYRLNEVHFVLNAMKEKRNHTGYVKPGKMKVSGGKKPKLTLTNLFAW